MYRLLAGFDPGGKKAFGWCLIIDGHRAPGRIYRSGVESDAGSALKSALAALGSHDLVAAGIDAPLFWVSNGDREVDKHLRCRHIAKKGQPGTVGHVNSLRGACLVQGMVLALELRKLFPKLAISEAHPKVTRRLLGGPGLKIYRHLLALRRRSEHERDAAVAALSAWAMLHKPQGWDDILCLDSEFITPLVPPPGYWVPK